MESFPQFNLNVENTLENEPAVEAFDRFASLVKADPMAVIMALKAYRAESKPTHNRDSLKKILVDEVTEQKLNNIMVESKQNDVEEDAQDLVRRVLPVYGLWKEIEREGYFTSLHEFDVETEEAIAEDDQIRDLIRALRNSSQRGAQDEARRQIRAARMQFYIGRQLIKTVAAPIEFPDKPDELGKASGL